MGAQSSRNIRSIAAAGSRVLSEWPEADVTVYQSFSLRCNLEGFHVVVFSKGVNRSEAGSWKRHEVLDINLSGTPPELPLTIS